ncbi:MULTISPECIES: hypothetical protein [Nocardioides]|uniref:Lipoprotein n=1 Tax=Nocardioides vastitatis TaxID=2568655 RepID=A0ABW0ZD84_9ACTN|nr:hypothetical protein [Nocardioides sp.]THJ00485.1 hypothetical protein E7Z54_11905 [Nocardioides sp.]
MPIQGSTIAGAVFGVVLLAGVVGFGVGLPELVGDSAESASSADLPELPDALDDRMVAVSAVTPEQVGVTTPQDEAGLDQVTEAAAENETEAGAALAEQYGAATVRAYIDIAGMTGGDGQTAPAHVAVTVVPGEMGLVIPNGPFAIDQSGSHYELREIDGHRCAVAWREEVDQMTGEPTGAEVPASAYQAECRAERDGVAYDVFSTGLEPEKLAGYLDRVLELTAED